MIKNLLEEIISILKDTKAYNIVVLDFHGEGPVVDKMVIATANVVTHLNAIVAKLQSVLGKGQLDASEGWFVFDYGDIMVHLFLPDKREFYSLEELWGDAEKVILN